LFIHYEKALKEIRFIVSKNENNAMELVVNFLHDTFSKYSWVGIYLLKNDELILGPWKGPHATEHVKIPIGEGICGAAAASGHTEIIRDVHNDQRYLACFITTRSEIVVPIKKEDIVRGEIDIDSDRLEAFNDRDTDFLEEVASILSKIV
jgi:GAF domain-containing protein